MSFGPKVWIKRSREW